MNRLGETGNGAKLRPYLVSTYLGRIKWGGLTPAQDEEGGWRLEANKSTMKMMGKYLTLIINFAMILLIWNSGSILRNS